MYLYVYVYVARAVLAVNINCVHSCCLITPVVCRTVVDARYLDRHLATGASVADIKPLHQQSPSEMPQEERAAAAVASQANTAKHTASTAPVNEVVNQIAFADIVLLNKVDLVSDEAAVQVERAIREINSLARVVHTRLNDDDCPNWLSTVRLSTITCSGETLILPWYLIPGCLAHLNDLCRHRSPFKLHRQHATTLPETYSDMDFALQYAAIFLSINAPRALAEHVLKARHSKLFSCTDQLVVQHPVG